MSKATLAKLSERIEELERIPDTELWTPLSSHLLQIVEMSASCMFYIDEADDDDCMTIESELSRRSVWPLWELLRITTAQAIQSAFGWESIRIPGELNADDFAEGIRAFLDLITDPELREDDASFEKLTAPFTPISLHVYKSMLWRGTADERYAVPVLNDFGVPDAIPIFDLLARVSPLPIWHHEFPLEWDTDETLNYGPAWPADVRDQVDAALVRSGSLPPAVVEPFDLRSIPRYRRGGGAWPSLTGGYGKRADPDYLHRSHIDSKPDASIAKRWEKTRQAKLVGSESSYAGPLLPPARTVRG